MGSRAAAGPREGANLGTRLFCIRHAARGEPPTSSPEPSTEYKTIAVRSHDHRAHLAGADISVDNALIAQQASRDIE